MRKLILFVGILLLAVTAKADIFSLGIKGGLNSSKMKFSDVTNIDGAKLSPADYELGYHFGAFARIKIVSLYVQPELLYTNMKAGINITDIPGSVSSLQSGSATAVYHNFDMPIMVGMKFGPARFNLGPVLSFKLSSDLKDATAEAKTYLTDFNESSNGFRVGGQVGVGLDILKKVTLDVRYEFGLSKYADGFNVGGTTLKTDQRQSQFIGSIGWMF